MGRLKSGIKRNVKPADEKSRQAKQLGDPPGSDQCRMLGVGPPKLGSDRYIILEDTKS